MRALIAGAAACGGLVLALSAAADSNDPDGIEAFGSVYSVLLSPRCMNCHPAGDAPLQTDHGRPHRMNITRRSPEVGLHCDACHRDSNGRTPGSPPGSAHWNMPSRAVPMVFEGRTPAQLCAQLKQPQATGGRDLDELVDHIERDPLVLWAFDPGPGRTLPPISHAELVTATRQWVAAGAPCPPE